jgi:hypothetical protein
MRSRIETSGLVLCAVFTCAALAAQGSAGPQTAGSALCGARLEVCTVPLSHGDALLDESTDNYMPAASRAIATAAAIDMATKLKSIYRECQAGHFKNAYEAHAGDIESLAGKQPQVDHARSAEIRSLKRARTALYADTVVGLQAVVAEGSASQEFLDAYWAREHALEAVVDNLSARQQMRARERAAVCEVLAAYGR